MRACDYIEGYLVNHKEEFFHFHLINEMEYAMKFPEVYLEENYKEVERYFLITFVNRKMSCDFPMIIKDFLMNNFSVLEHSHVTSKYVKDKPYESLLDIHMSTRFLEFKFLNILLFEATENDEFSKVQIIKIYQTYYKKEYNQLKKFSALSADDIVTLACGKKEVHLDIIARIMIMSKFMDISIDIDLDIGPLITIFKLENSLCKEPGSIFMDEELDKGIVKNLRRINKDIVVWMENENNHQKLLDTFEEARGYASTALQMLGYEEILLIKSKEEIDELLHESMFDTLFAMYVYNRKEIVDWNKAISYLPLKLFLNLFVGTLESLNIWINRCMNIEDGCEDENDTLYKPEIWGLKSNSVTSEKHISKSENKSIDYQVEELLGEIDELKESLREKKLENDNLHRLYSETKKQCRQYEVLKNKYEVEHAELVELRKHAYEKSSDIQRDTENIGDATGKMELSIAEKRIAIIGGHKNWNEKLRKKFKNWIFISIEVGNNVDEKVLNNIEFVYFYTEYISHSLYYKYIRIIRKKGIPFGYINSTNIKQNIAQIYKEQIQDK